MTEMSKLFPAFLLADRNGNAMAAAIYAAMKLVREKVQNALKLMTDVSAMPEWMLDEMAWEIGGLYDYSADIEAKRRWIERATPLFAALGTPKAIYDFLEGYFKSVQLEESAEYGGEPYHFRITVSGAWDEQKAAWVRKAVDAAKNVRSVLDDVSIGSYCSIQVSGMGVAGYSRAPLCGELHAGEYPGSEPELAMDSVIPECGDWLAGQWPEK